MKFRVTKKTIIGNALLWAAALLIGSYFMRGSESWSVMFIFLIGGFTIVNSHLSNLLKKQQGIEPKC